MELDTRLTRHRLAFTIALTAAAALTLAGCASADSAPPAPGESSSEEATADSIETGNDTDDSGEAVLPADFPQEILISDGDLLAASGGQTSWEIVKTVQHVDQVRVAVDSNVKLYGFTITESVDVDSDSPSWRMASDAFDIVVEVTAGEPVTVRYAIESR